MKELTMFEHPPDVHFWQGEYADGTFPFYTIQADRPLTSYGYISHHCNTVLTWAGAMAMEMPHVTELSFKPDPVLGGNNMDMIWQPLMSCKINDIFHNVHVIIETSGRDWIFGKWAHKFANLLHYGRTEDDPLPPTLVLARNGAWIITVDDRTTHAKLHEFGVPWSLMYPELVSVRNDESDPFKLDASTPA